MWYRCLYARQGTDLRGPLRAGISAAALLEQITGAWRARNDRGAELRKTEHQRGAFIAIEELRRNPHLEMHTRGG
jgi:cyclic pyranopterin phosphate synthase